MIKKILILNLLFLPLFVLGQYGASEPAEGGFSNLWGFAEGIGRLMWQFFVILAVVMFVYAGILYLTASGNAEKISQAHKAVLWGTVGIVVAILAYSIIAIIRNFLGA